MEKFQLFSCKHRFCHVLKSSWPSVRACAVVPRCRQSYAFWEKEGVELLTDHSWKCQKKRVLCQLQHGLGNVCHVMMELKVSLPIIVLFCITDGGCQLASDAFEPNHPSVKRFDSSSFMDSPPFQHVSPRSLDDDIPMILWWTGRLFMSGGIKQLRCPSSVCYSTGDRRYKDDPRLYGLYFYGTDLDPEDMPVPRKPHHEWALFHEESPMNNYMLVHDTMLKLFNHTSTFRRESDYPIVTNALENLNYLLKRKPVSIEIKNKARRTGLAPVLFIQSHCNVGI